MAKLIGKWKLESSENFDEYMKAVGVNFALRKMANVAKPQQIISLEGDEWILQSKSMVKNSEVKCKVGVPFEENTADGRTVTTTLTVEGDTKIVQDQKGEVDSVLTRELQGENDMLMTCVAKDVTCLRHYKRET